MGATPLESQEESLERILVQPGEEGSVEIITQNTENFTSAGTAFTVLTGRIRKYKVMLYSFGLVGTGSVILGGQKVVDVLFKFTEPSVEKITIGAGLIALGIASFGLSHYANDNNKLTIRQLGKLEESTGIIDQPTAPEDNRALQP